MAASAHWFNNFKFFPSAGNIATPIDGVIVSSWGPM